MNRVKNVVIAAVLGLAGILSALPAHACAVCFGDPNDPMVKGTAAGILLLAGTIYTLLLGIGGITALWLVRSRRLHRLPRESDLPTQ